MNQLTSDKQQQAISAYQELMQSAQSIILSTIDDLGNPHASYAPFAMDSDKNIYLLVSELSLHTKNLLKTEKASVLFIQDEAKTAQIFARRRINFDCKVIEIQRSDAAWDNAVEYLQKRFGDTATMLASMLDFHLFKLVPQKGRFVMDFGGAYEITNQNLDRLIHLKMGGSR